MTQPASRAWQTRAAGRDIVESLQATTCKHPRRKVKRTMFKLASRTSAIAIVAAAALGSGVAASSASAATPAVPTTSMIIAVSPSEIGLLLPAVQKVREAARR